MRKTLSITQARAALTTLVEKANKTQEDYVITVNGSPAAVLMSVNAYESLKETLEVMSDPELVKAIREGEKDYENGDYIELDDLIKEIESENEI